MQDFLRWLASWKGVPVEDGVEVQFEFASFPSGGLALLVLLGLLALVVLVVAIYRRDGKNLRPWQRVVLGSLRAIALLAAATLLLEPSVVSVERQTRPGHTILLVDTSQSMNQIDAFRREAVQGMASGWVQVGVDDPATTPRIQLLKKALAHADGQLVEKLASRNDVQLFAFSGGISELPLLPPPPAPLGPDGQPLPQEKTLPKLDLQKLEADGRYSNLGGALRSALDKSRNAEIAAVVLLTDGRRNAGPQGAEIARMLNQRKVPHTFVLGVGDPSETQSVAIGRFEAPEKVFQKDPFELRGTVVAQGYDPMQVTVRLVRLDDKGAREEIGSRQVTIGDGGEGLVEWKGVTSEQVGRFTYRMELQPPTGELPMPERHQRDLPVEVLGERARVLLLSGGSNFEYQILRNLLIRDKTIDVSCWLQSADPKFPQDGDEGVRIEALPVTQAELEVYDVVILIDPDQSKLTRPFTEMLRRHVVENGCGLWWVCGEKFTLDSLRDTASTRPIAELLPVIPDVRFAESSTHGFGYGKAYVQPKPYTLTPEGQDGLAAKITRLAEGKDESRLLWSRLPGFHVSFPVKDVKPAATIIAEDRNVEPQLRRQGGGMPLIVTQFVGAGRVLFSGMDGTYRWRMVFEDAYDTYWVKGIRYLFEGRANAGNSRLRILIGDDKIELGEALTITAEAKNEALQPLIADAVELTLEREGKPVDTVRLEPVAETPGTYQLQLRPDQIGGYRLRSVHAEGREVEVAFQVVPAQIESEGPVDRGELSAIASATGGRLFDTPAELLSALDEIPSRSATDTYRTPHAIWDGMSTVVFVLVVLSLEWLLRKRFNLL